MTDDEVRLMLQGSFSPRKRKRREILGICLVFPLYVDFSLFSCPNGGKVEAECLPILMPSSLCTLKPLLNAGGGHGVEFSTAETKNAVVISVNSEVLAWRQLQHDILS